MIHQIYFIGYFYSRVKIYSLGLELVELVELLTHLRDGIVVLLAEVGEGGLVLDVGLLEVAAQLAELGLALLVQLDLSGGGATGFLKALTQLLKLASEVGTLLLGLSASLAFGFDLLLELFDAGLQFLDLFLVLADKGLFVLQLGGEGRDLLVLALDGLLELLLVALEVGDGLLGELEVTLDLPPLLLNVSAQLLLALQRVLEFVKGLLQLLLNLVEVVDLVLGGLELLGGLLVGFSLELLLLVQLVDELVLVGDLVVQVADLVVLGGLVLFGLLDGEFQVLNILLEAGDFLFQLLLSLEELVAGILLLGKAVLGILQYKTFESVL